MVNSSLKVLFICFSEDAASEQVESPGRQGPVQSTFTHPTHIHYVTIGSALDGEKTEVVKADTAPALTKRLVDPCLWVPVQGHRNRTFSNNNPIPTPYNPSWGAVAG